MWRCNRVGSLSRVRRSITVSVDRLWDHVWSDGITEFVRVEDEFGYRSEINVSWLVSENELLSEDSRPVAYQE